MKRAATHLFKRQSENRAFFQNYRTFTLRPPPREQTPGQDRGAKTRPQEQLKCANPLGSSGGWSGLELSDTSCERCRSLFRDVVADAKFVQV